MAGEAGDLPAPPPSPSPPPSRRVVLRWGDRGDDVATWQRALHADGVDPGAVDGDFGPAIEAATRELQRRAGLIVDGIAGPRTMAAALDAAQSPQVPLPQPGVRALGVALLKAARRELAASAREEPPGSDDGPRMRDDFAGAACRRSREELPADKDVN